MAKDQESQNERDGPSESDATFSSPSEQDTCGPLVSASPPRMIGRYDVVAPLGSGGFGRVYKAYDGELQRHVAIKVPRRDLGQRQVELYREEGRTLAQLDHPNIAPVFDVGSDDTFPVFIVSKFVDGPSLAQYIRSNRFSIAQAVELVAAVASALHHAHRNDCVHRDIKPANIVLDQGEVPHVVDFGLALREKDLGKGPRFVGTLAYMSPELARGEGHRVDGRTDIFSLAVILYELLTQVRPFRGDSDTDLLDVILRYDPKPLRQINDAISVELENIVLKALSKRSTDRFSTARDFADGLLDCRTCEGVAPPTLLPPDELSDADSSQGALTDTTLPSIESSGQSLRVVPKGLRAFDRFDAHFFLRLLPGPRDAQGMPDSIRFWKDQIEDKTTGETFKVGLLYGPSGSGKSSLVKAGLLPHLRSDIVSIYVEANVEGTVSSIVRSLSKRLSIADELSLPEVIAGVRTGQLAIPGRKLLLVIDQFEQWLQANDEKQTELEEALRQCDGARTQALILVRDDFWMAVSRFWQRLEIPLHEDRNSRGIDLFSINHAKTVLKAFGRAHQDLPQDDFGNDKLLSDEDRFIARAVDGLVDGSRVICAHLAIFSEMMKGRPWNDTTLEALGGTEGLGVVFLEESFGRATSPPSHRYYQRPVRAVLAALLPQSASLLKRNMVSIDELAMATGMRVDSDDFRNVIRILERELRLITPAEPGGVDDLDLRTQQQQAPCYQLAHDYLVPSIRRWLYAKERETRRGRAALMLRERAAAWSVNSHSTQLLSLLEYVTAFTAKKPSRWTPAERKLMRRSGRRHLFRMMTVGVLLFATALVALRGRAINLQANLRVAASRNAKAVADDLSDVPLFGKMQLAKLFHDHTAERDARLNAAIGMLGRSQESLEFALHTALTHPSITTFAHVIDELSPHREQAHEFFAAQLAETSRLPSERMRAALGIAAITGNDELDDRTTMALGQYMTRPERVAVLMQAVDSMRHMSIAVRARLQFLAIRNARSAEFGRTWEVIEGARRAPWTKWVDELLEEGTPPEGSDVRGYAQLAVASLLQAQNPEGWERIRAFRSSEFKAWFAELYGTSGGGMLAPARELAKTVSVAERRFLLHVLARCSANEVESTVRSDVETAIRAMLSSGDAGVHATADWALRNLRWDADLTEPNSTACQWHVAERLKFTMVELTADEFTMGEQVLGGLSESQREHEPVQRCRISRRFAISAQEITNQQYWESLPSAAERTGLPDHPATKVTWYQAVGFCNWLSEQEGLTPCYEPNSQGKYAEGMQTKGDYLRSDGYRLPTEAEWEFACRAGTDTQRPYGNDDSLLPYYAVYGSAHPQEVGQLCPNAFGLFDMLGNAIEWCQPEWADQAPDVDQVSDSAEVLDNVERVIRGGSFMMSNPASIRSAARFWAGPADENVQIGFRVARTLPTGA